MNAEAQRIAIAEACGYKWYKTYRARYGRRLSNPFGERMLLNDAQSEIHLCEPTDDISLTINLNGIPDYLNDLNAMHEAEKVLNKDQEIRYATEIYSSSPTGILYLSATAAQRAEAFLRTLNLWTP